MKRTIPGMTSLNDTFLRRTYMAEGTVTRTYGGAIRDGFAYLLGNYPESFSLEGCGDDDDSGR